VCLKERLAAAEAIPLLWEVLYGQQGTAEMVAPPGLALFRKDKPKLRRPLSRWLSSQISEASYAELASLADTGSWHDRFDDIIQRAKSTVTLDRGMWAAEKGYAVHHLRICGLDMPKTIC